MSSTSAPRLGLHPDRPARSRAGTTQRIAELTPSLQSKIAVITGASTGIGFAIAKQFVAEGASVVITGRRQNELDAAVAEIGDRAFGVCADVSSLPNLDGLFETVKQKYGRIDVLVA